MIKRLRDHFDALADTKQSPPTIWTRLLPSILDKGPFGASFEKRTIEQEAEEGCYIVSIPVLPSKSAVKSLIKDAGIDLDGFLTYLIFL